MTAIYKKSDKKNVIEECEINTTYVTNERKINESTE